MFSFVLRRLLSGLLVIAGVAVIVFILFNVLPADPASMMLGQRSDSTSMANIQRELGINQPVSVRFLKFLDDLSPLAIYSDDETSSYYINRGAISGVTLFIAGNSFVVLKFPYMRRSYQTKRPVSAILMEKLPDTAILAIAAIIIASLLGILLGIIAAVYRDSWVDRFCLFFSVFFVSLPSFFAAILFAWLFGFVLSHWTGLPMTGGWKGIDPFTGEYTAYRNLVLPSVVLGLRPLSIIAQLTRSSMLEVLSFDYIRTARAKGVSGKIVILRHALINAMNPVVTAISGWLGSLLAGAVFIEYIFGWNGIGKLTVQALEHYDLPVVMGIVLLVSFVFVILNILADLANAWLDPRIRIIS